LSISLVLLERTASTSWCNKIGDDVEELKTLGAVRGDVMAVGWWTTGVSPDGVSIVMQHSFMQN
jgi:hypothetical protein